MYNPCVSDFIQYLNISVIISKLAYFFVLSYNRFIVELKITQNEAVLFWLRLHSICPPSVAVKILVCLCYFYLQEECRQYFSYLPSLSCTQKSIIITPQPVRGIDLLCAELFICYVLQWSKQG